MTKNELNDTYFNWMCQLVFDGRYSKKLSYRRLLKILHKIEFIYSIPMDGNRAEDGIDLRYRFGYENGYSSSMISAYLDNKTCSVLEMMIALAIRCEEHIMDDPDVGNRTGQWFWNMIVNLGLGSMNDSKFDRAYIEEIVQNEDVKKQFLKTFNQLTYRHRSWDVWRDFIIMFACSLSNPVDKFHYEEREKRYLKIIKKYNKREQEQFPELAAYVVMALEENPEQDFLGSIFMELNLGDKSNSQFFTPYHVCELMAKVTEEDVAAVVKEKGYITINDSCCGAGATLIAAINEARKQLEKVNLNFQNHVLVVAQDIDEIVALMCYIQLSLLGVAAYIKVGDVFTQPMSTDDNGENYWFTMMYFSDVWTMRRVFHSL